MGRSIVTSVLIVLLLIFLRGHLLKRSNLPMGGDINYSQSWEDPYTVIHALDIKPTDHVVAITSAGDNVLALLLQQPQRLTAIDFNPAQTYFFELKLAALKVLNYDDFLIFLGLRDGERLPLFSRVKDLLSPEALQWWNQHTRLIKKGIMHSGKLEHFTKVFCNYLMPFLFSREAINAWLNSSTEAERECFFLSLNNPMIMITFKVFLDNFVRLARDESTFKYVTKSLGEQILEHAHYLLVERSVNDNWFLHYVFTGMYDEKALPPYLIKENFYALKNLLPRLNIVTASLTDYLAQIKQPIFDKFYLSDIFEYLSEEESDRLFNHIAATIRPEGRLIYWNNVVERSYPSSLDSIFMDLRDLAESLQLQDRFSFYQQLKVHQMA